MLGVSRPRKSFPVWKLSGLIGRCGKLSGSMFGDEQESDIDLGKAPRQGVDVPTNNLSADINSYTFNLTIGPQQQQPQLTLLLLLFVKMFATRAMQMQATRALRMQPTRVMQMFQPTRALMRPVPVSAVPSCGPSRPRDTLVMWHGIF